MKLGEPAALKSRMPPVPPFHFQPWQFGATGPPATKRTYPWGYFNPSAKTVRTRTLPFISPHASKRDTVEKQQGNHGWYRMNAADRAKTPEGFAGAFFLTNP